MNPAQGQPASALDVSVPPPFFQRPLRFFEACSATAVSFDRLSAIAERLVDEPGGSIACRGVPGGDTRLQILAPRCLRE